MTNSFSTKALVIEPQKNVYIDSVEIRRNSQEELKLSWLVSAVCNSERRRFKLTKSHKDNFPFIGGHEAIGFSESDTYIRKKYALLPHSNCLTRNEINKCLACKNNKENLCTKMRHAGLDQGTPSGFTEAMFVPHNQLFDVSDLDDELAPFLEPLSCVIRSWERIDTGIIEGGKTVGIVGGGPIGCLHAFYINKLNSNNKIIIFEHNTLRRKVLENIFSYFKNINVEEVQKDRFCDITVMAASNTSAYETCLALTRQDGIVILFSGLDEIDYMTDKFLPEYIHRQEFVHYSSDKVFVGSSGYTAPDLLKSKTTLFNFSELKKLITGKVYGLDSYEILNNDGTKTIMDEPILINDVLGALQHHVKIQYFNNHK